MTELLLLAGLALGGELIVEANIPAEIHVDGQPLVQVFHPAEVKLAVAEGERELTVYTGGTPARYTVEILDDGATVVVVGRTGVTTGRRAPPPPREDATPLAVEVRNAAPERVMFVLAGQRHTISPGDVLQLELGPGDHALSVRNSRGTLVWARGTLHVQAAEGPVLIQVAEGVLPEVARGPASFSPSDTP